MSDLLPFGTTYLSYLYFLLAPLYSYPDPGIEVDLRSTFFLGAH
jgi:hypothetical protein